MNYWCPTFGVRERTGTGGVYLLVSEKDYELLVPHLLVLEKKIGTSGVYLLVSEKEYELLVPHLWCKRKNSGAHIV